MKSSKEFITSRLDELALQYHDKFYADLSKELQETIWMMAHKQYQNYLGGFIDATHDRIKDELSSRE